MPLAYRGPYIDPDTVKKSYRPKPGTMSPALLRARQPYKVKNAITGVLLGLFAVGVWSYSIRAVRQDVFDDVDEEAKEMAAIGGTLDIPSIEDQQNKGTVTAPSNAKVAVNPVRHEGTLVDSAKPRPSAGVVYPRGLLVDSRLEKWFPRLLDSKHKTLVTRAPNVDSIGSMRESYY